jgi:hypothetical protein
VSAGVCAGIGSGDSRDAKTPSVISNRCRQLGHLIHLTPGGIFSSDILAEKRQLGHVNVIKIFSFFSFPVF